MKTLITTLSVLLLFSCEKIDVPEGTPKCIKKEIRKRKSDDCFTAVEKYTYNGETVYGFAYGNGCADVPGVIFDEECEQICTVGGFSGNGDGQCPDFDQAAFIEVIWEKE